MQDILTKNILREKRRSLLIAILGAILVSSLVLAASFGLDYFTGDTNTSPMDDSDYVLELNGFMTAQYEDNHIVAVSLGGNATGSVHSDLVYSSISKLDDGNWNASNFLLDENFMGYQNYIIFTDQQISTAYGEFTTAITQTEEIEQPEENGGDLDFQLFFSVYLDDFTVVEFAWFAVQDVSIISVSYRVWNYNEDGSINVHVTAEDTHYLNPASVFNSFLQVLQDMYSVIG